MTIPGGAGTLCEALSHPSRARHTGFSHRVGVSLVYFPPALRSAPPRCCRYNRRGRAPVACGGGASSTARGGALVKRARAPYRVRRAPAFILVAGRGSCARKRRGVPADVAGAPYIRTQGHRPLYCRWPRVFYFFLSRGPLRSAGPRVVFGSAPCVPQSAPHPSRSGHHHSQHR